MTTKDILNNYWRDLKKGENLLMTATVVIAVVLILLRLFGCVKDSIVNVGILIVLSVFLISNYILRLSIELLSGKVVKLDDDISNQKVNLDDFVGEWHKYNLTQTFAKANRSIKIINRIGYNSLKSNFSLLLDALNKGCDIKVIIGDANVAKNQSIWSWSDKTRDDYQRDHEMAIALYKELDKEKKTGKLEVKTIPVAFSYSAVIIDSENLDSDYMVAPYSYPSKSDYGWQITSNEKASQNFTSFIEKDFDLAWNKATILEFE